MGKKKLVHFRENLLFPHLFQPTYQELQSGFRLKGLWNRNFFENQNPIILELGCGKGDYTVGLARMHPEYNFIGIDWKGARLWRGCKTVEELQLNNAGFVRAQIGQITHLFASEEISEIWITFPDPQKGKERKRLTAPGFLDKYAKILKPQGSIYLKTDDAFFFYYTLDVVRKHGFRVISATDDLYHSEITGEVTTIRTYYESIWLESGKKICYLEFKIQ